MRFALLLPLLLAACAGAAPRQAALSPEQEACRSEAESSTPAQEFGRRWNPANENLMAELRAERTRAVEAAYRDCLRRRGVVRGGGVERVQR